MQFDTFDSWLAGLDLRYWGTAQHKISAAHFFEQQGQECAVLLDVRSAEEAAQMALPFAMHIPLEELPARWHEIPTDCLVATFCSSVTRAVVAWTYLQLRGLVQVRILDAGYGEFCAELKPGKVFRRLQESN